MKKFLSFISIVFIIGCTNEGSEVSKLGNNLILYINVKDYQSEVLIFDLDNMNEISTFNLQPMVKCLFFKKDKLLILPQGSSNGNYKIYDLKNKEVIIKKFQCPDPSLTGWHLNYKDSLLIYTDLVDVYFESFNDNSVDSINLNVDFVYNLACNKEGILAILYNDEDKPEDINNPKDLLFVDLVTKDRKYAAISPVEIADWSPDGKKLIYRDTIFKVFDYEKQISKELKGLNSDTLKIVSDLKYLNDNLLVLQGEVLKNSTGEVGLYLFDINEDRIIKKIKSKSGTIMIFDTYSSN